MISRWNEYHLSTAASLLINEAATAAASLADRYGFMALKAKDLAGPNLGVGGFDILGAPFSTADFNKSKARMYVCR